MNVVDFYQEWPVQEANLSHLYKLHCKILIPASQCVDESTDMTESVASLRRTCFVLQLVFGHHADRSNPSRWQALLS